MLGGITEGAIHSLPLGIALLENAGESFRNALLRTQHAIPLGGVLLKGLFKAGTAEVAVDHSYRLLVGLVGLARGATGRETKLLKVLAGDVHPSRGRIPLKSWCRNARHLWVLSCH